VRQPVGTNSEDRESIRTIGQDVPVATLFVALPMLNADILEIDMVNLAQPMNKTMKLVPERDTSSDCLVGLGENEPAETIATRETTRDTTKSTNYETRTTTI